MKPAFLLALLLCSAALPAQLQDNLKLQIEAGLLRTGESQDVGFFLNVEPKLEVFQRGVIGLRTGLAMNAHSYQPSDNQNIQIDTIAGNGVYGWFT